MTHKIALAYARWLTTPLGQSPAPPILYIFIFCPLAMFVVLGYYGPYYAAYFHAKQNHQPINLPLAATGGLSWRLTIVPCLLAENPKKRVKITSLN